MFAPAGQAPKTKPLNGNALNKETYRYIQIGHTHKEKEQIVGNGVKYFNSEYWTVRRSASGENESRLCFVIVQKEQDGSPVGWSKVQ